MRKGGGVHWKVWCMEAGGMHAFLAGSVSSVSSVYVSLARVGGCASARQSDDTAKALLYTPAYTVCGLLDRFPLATVGGFATLSCGLASRAALFVFYSQIF